MLDLDAVTLQYRQPDRVTVAASRVTLSVERGERLVLLGPSGCGKTSLLKAVAGFITPAAGEIRIAGRTVTGPGPDRIMVFQEFDQLVPWKTVKANIMFPLLATRRCRRREAEARALVWIDKVGLGEFAAAYPHTLSGGMKQRTAIARALVMEPDILLMDEPFAALDALTRSTMQEELLRLCGETTLTLLFVTHSIEEAVVLGTRIAVLTPQPGQVRDEFPGVAAGAEAAALAARIRGLVAGAAPR
jgi:NitT/TauT family transport system ATP-binding protein